jgi:hypothetical protein
MELGSKAIILGCVLLILSVPFSYFGLLMFILYIVLGILVIILGIFRNKGYSNKTYYLLSSSVVALWGLILLYIFLFSSEVYLTNKNLFYFNVVVFLCFIIMISRTYLNRHKNLKMPWKNEW